MYGAEDELLDQLDEEERELQRMMKKIKAAQQREEKAVQLKNQYE